jgi:hypothetical protein
MPHFPAFDPTWQTRLEPVFRLYASLLRGVDPELGLGGKLLWAGDLDEGGCALMRAANIAGAASLGCTADAVALRHANRDGVADFLVNSLDEALRILKNEIRKRQVVSVGISVAAETVAEEMQEWGVLPDLLPSADNAGGAALSWFLASGSRRIENAALPEGWSFRAWSSAPAGFDAAAAAILPQQDQLNRRWIRLSPRYLGPSARRLRSLACSAEIEALLTQSLAEHPGR